MMRPGSAITRSITFLTIYAVGLLCFSSGLKTVIPVPFLPAGIAVAAVYRWGRSQWIPILAAGAALMLVAGIPWQAAVAGGSGFVAAALSSSWLLERHGFDPGFSRAKDVVLLLLAALGGMAVAPTVGVLECFMFGIPPWSSVPHWSSEPQLWLRWWSEVAGGAVLVAPPLLAINRQRLARFREHGFDAACWAPVCCSVAR